MVDGPADNEGKLRRWKAFLVLSGLALVAFGVWQMTLGNVGNGLGMIVVPVVTVAILLTLLRSR